MLLRWRVRVITVLVSSLIVTTCCLVGCSDNKHEAAQLVIQEIDRKLRQHYIESGSLYLPNTGAASPNGLNIPERIVDPWGRLYRFRSPGLHNKDWIDIWSDGPDMNTKADDIRNW